MSAQSPLDDEDPLEAEAPPLHIGEATVEEEDSAFRDVQDKACANLNLYRLDPYYSNEIPEDAEEQLTNLLNKHRMVFSTTLTGRPPCAITPIKIPLKQGAVPVKSKPRRYPPQKQAFLAETCDQLLQEKLVRKVNTAEWVSAPLLVPKPPPDRYRMTIDLRPINLQTQKDTRPMPNMETMLLDVAGDHFFTNADLKHAYYQVAVEPTDRHLHTFRGADSHSLYEPLRSLQGAKNSGIHLQVGATELFDQIKKQILIWLDDWLLHSKTFQEHIEVLATFLSLCKKHGFTLSPEKCNFFAKIAKWCGRKITAQGVTLDPRRIDGLLSMHRPETAGDLQQFLCALNWMRNGIPRYTETTAPLQTLLQALMEKHGSKKTKLIKVMLTDDLWTKNLQVQFEVIKTQLATRVELNHLDTSMQLCLHTDASDLYHAAVLTQIPKKDLEKPQAEQVHSPLAFISGTFKDAMSRWSILEKEAYAIVHAMSRLDYLTSCAETTIFTDHRNLIFLFDPRKSQPNMPTYLVSKIQRWALILSQFEYSVAHVPGELNYFPDLMTRWGASAGQTAVGKLRRIFVPVPKAQQELDIHSFTTQIQEAQAKLTSAEKQMLTIAPNKPDISCKITKSMFHKKRTNSKRVF